MKLLWPLPVQAVNNIDKNVYLWEVYIIPMHESPVTSQEDVAKFGLLPSVEGWGLLYHFQLLTF